jgi:hypothetical protein
MIDENQGINRLLEVLRVRKRRHCTRTTLQWLDLQGSVRHIGAFAKPIKQ